VPGCRHLSFAATGFFGISGHQPEKDPGTEPGIIKPVVVWQRKRQVKKLAYSYRKDAALRGFTFQSIPGYFPFPCSCVPVWQGKYFSGISFSNGTPGNRLTGELLCLAPAQAFLRNQPALQVRDPHQVN
jgi:hypothetical protein